MQQLYFARHGESTASHFSIWSPDEASLTELGRWQAAASGCDARQHGLEFDLIISLPHQHAYETAHLIAEEVDYPVKQIALLDDFDARNEEELTEQARELYELLQKTREQRILVVGHDALGHVLLSLSGKMRQGPRTTMDSDASRAALARSVTDGSPEAFQPLAHAQIIQFHPAG